MKIKGIVGFALLSVAGILFIVGLPALVLSISHSCPPNSYAGDCSHVEELPLSSFAAAFAIGGIGLLALNHFDHQDLKDRKADV